MKLQDVTFSGTMFAVHKWSRRLWVRTILIACMAIIAAIASRLLNFIIPEVVVKAISDGSVAQILEIMASSMLAVTIFSLSVMVSARQAASTQVTPRSHQLLLEDTVTHSVLATFLGAFVFSLVALIELTTGFYGQRSAVVILAFTLLVISMVVVAILRWINHLSDLGSVVETTKRVEEAAAGALEQRVEFPCLGANALTDGQLEIPARAQVLAAQRTGYIQHVDLSGLSRCAEQAGGNVFILAAPGKLVTPGETLLFYTGDIDETALRRAHTIGDTRRFDQDPRFGAVVLAEIAQRALSPGINDPGTAIDIIGRLLRVLIPFRDETRLRDNVKFPRLWMVPVTAKALLQDGFEPIMRDGAGMIEVQIRLQKALARLAQSPDSAMAQAARDASQRALTVALQQQRLDEDRDRLTELSVK